MADRTRKGTWSDGFCDGVLSVLAQMTYSGDADSTFYREVVRAHGEAALIVRARRNRELRGTGLSVYIATKKEYPNA